MQEKYSKLITRSCTGVIIGSFAFTYAIEFISRDWSAQLKAVNWMHFTVFAAFPVALAAALIFGVRVHVLKKKTDADKQMLFMAAMATLAAYASMTTINGAYYRALFKGEQRITYGDGFVRLTGAIADDLAQQLEAHSDSSLRLGRVELEGPGGDPAGALAGGRWLRAHGVQRAVVTGDCASACAILALMFPERDIAPGGRLGFHSIISPSGDNLHATGVQRDVNTVLAENGIAGDLLARLFNSRDVVWYTRDELVSANIVADCWDSVKREVAPCVK